MHWCCERQRCYCRVWDNGVLRCRCLRSSFPPYDEQLPEICPIIPLHARPLLYCSRSTPTKKGTLRYVSIDVQEVTTVADGRFPCCFVIKYTLLYNKELNAHAPRSAKIFSLPVKGRTMSMSQFLEQSKGVFEQTIKTILFCSDRRHGS